MKGQTVKKHGFLRRGLALIMCLALVITDMPVFPGMGPVYAMDTEAGSEDADVGIYEETDVPEDGYGDDDTAGEEAAKVAVTELYLATKAEDLDSDWYDMLETDVAVDGYGDTGSATYKDGVLTLDNYQISGERDCYVSDDHSINAGIYCKGDLTIVLKGENILGGDGDRAGGGDYEYGIYVEGNLTIKNLNGDNASLYIGAPSDPSDELSEGIRCTEYFTIQNNSSGSTTITVHSGSSEKKSIAVHTNRKLSVTSATLTALSGDAKTQSRGISCGSIAVSGGTITATGADCPLESEGISCGTIENKNKGKISAYAGSCTGASAQSCGILCGDITADSGSVDGKGGTAPYSYGITGDDGGYMTFSGNARICGTGGANATFSTGLCFKQHSRTTIGGYASLVGIGGVDSENSIGADIFWNVIISGQGSLSATGQKLAEGSSGYSRGFVWTPFTGSGAPDKIEITGGRLLARGYDCGFYAVNDRGEMYAPVCIGTSDFNGNNAVIAETIGDDWRYVELTAERVVVLIDDWTFGDTQAVPAVRNIGLYGDGSATAKYYYEGIKGTTYPESTTAPKDAGVYRVSAYLSTEQMGSKEFRINPFTLTEANIILDEQAEYDGTEKNAVFQVKNGGTILAEGTDYTVSSGNNTTDAGDITLVLDGIGNYTGTVSKTWSLKKAALVEGDFDIPVISTQTYNGDPATALVVPVLKEGKSGCGNIILKYDGKTELPVNAGDYAVTFDVEEGTNFLNAEGLSYGILTINKADNDIWATNAIIRKDADTVDLSNLVYDETGEVVYEIKGSDLGCSLNGSVLTSGGTTGTVTVTAKAAGDENHKEGSADITVTITDKQLQTIRFASASVNRINGDEDFSLTVTGAYTPVSYESSNTDVAVIDSNGKVHIIGAGKTYIRASAAETEEYAAAYAICELYVSEPLPSAVVINAPAAKAGLKYSGEELELVVAGSADGGKIKYAQGTDETTVPADDKFAETVPVAKDPGTYYVWYKVFADAEHSDTSPECLKVVIEEAEEQEAEEKENEDQPVSDKLHVINVNTGAVAKNSKGEPVNTARENEVISISWTERDDRIFTGWKLNGASPEDPASANTVFKMGGTDVTVDFGEKLKITDEVKEVLPDNYDTSVKVKKLKFENSRLTLNRNEKATKNAATPETEGTAPEVIYVTENNDIVAVDGNGCFYPVGDGETTVTAYCGNKKATCKVTVVSYTTNIAVRDITDAVVNDTTIEIKGGETMFLTVSFEPYDSTDPRSIKWRSDNKNVTVRNGIISAKEVKEAVTAVITATVKASGTESGEITKQVTVHVTPMEVAVAESKDKTHTLTIKKSLKLVTNEESNKAELDIKLKAKKGGDIKSVQIISVTSSNPDVVSVNAAGQISVDGSSAVAKAGISAGKAGTAYIMVTTSSDGGKTVNVRRCKVTVTSPAKDIVAESGSLTLKDNRITMRKGFNGTVKVRLDPEFSTDIGKVKLSGSKGIKVKNGIIYATKVTDENKPAKLTVKCGKLKKVIEVMVTK